jgi:regulator of replication initiation timing
MFDPATIGAALASAKTVLDLVKNANDAQLALRISGEIASLQGKLIDVQQQALALQDENQRLRDEIRQLNAKLAETVEAEPCPRCRRKGWRVESSEPDSTFGELGGIRRLYKCEFCGFSESQLMTAK